MHEHTSLYINGHQDISSSKLQITCNNQISKKPDLKFHKCQFHITNTRTLWSTLFTEYIAQLKLKVGINGKLFQFELLTLLLIIHKMISEHLTIKKGLPNTNKMGQEANPSITENKIYYNKNNMKNEQDENYTLLKENEFDGFCLDSRATRT